MATTAHQTHTTASPSALRVYRVARGMTIADLSEAADLSRNCISLVERRKVTPSRRTRRLLSTVLQIPEAGLFPEAPNG